MRLFNMNCKKVFVLIFWQWLHFRRWEIWSTCTKYRRVGLMELSRPFVRNRKHSIQYLFSYRRNHKSSCRNFFKKSLPICLIQSCRTIVAKAVNDTQLYSLSLWRLLINCNNILVKLSETMLTYQYFSCFP
jgi:hypothetical protein